MSWLPCIRRGTERWWLPRSAAATEAIARLLMAGSPAESSEASTVNPSILSGAITSLHQEIQRLLAADPPLLIFCAVQVDDPYASPASLADWLIKNATNKFASGDAFTSAPADDEWVQQRIRRLESHYQTLPWDRWLEDAQLWLQLRGPKVPTSWQHQWPQLSSELDGSEFFATEFEGEVTQSSDSATTGGDVLQQLARRMQWQRSLENSFDKRLHQSKLASIKQLAYGLSHEINNPLANISTRAQQLQRGEADPDRVSMLGRISDQVFRAHAMIADLMFYANPPQPKLANYRIQDQLVELIEVASQELASKSIRIEKSLSNHVLWVEADQKMIAEAIRVLFRNAAEAIGNQGTIVVSVDSDPDRIQIHIADSGPGLSLEARKHAFDPYFSGREAGRGLGLGLCRAYRIAKLHHGEATIASGPAGCVASISIPRRSS